MNKTILKKILFKIGLYNIYLWLIYYGHQKTASRKRKENYTANISLCTSNIFENSRPVAFLDLENSSLAIYLIGLIYAFGKAGYNIVIKKNYDFISRVNFPKALFFHFNFLTVAKDHYSYKNPIIIYDRTRKRESYSRDLKKVYLSADVLSRRYNDLSELMLPFLHHPELYFNNEIERTGLYRKNKKDIWCFFSGNFDVDKYRNENLRTFFHIENRYDLIQNIRRHFREDKLLILVDSSEIEVPFGYIDRKIIITDWTWNPIRGSVKIESRVHNKKWLEVLSRSVFFLGLPGVHIPMCHNLIEAMSVGSIPILEYADQFNPALKHMENAIIFKGIEDFIDKLEMILALDDETVNKMRINVLKYYDSYIDPAKTLERIIKSEQNDLNVYYFDEYKSVDAYKNRTPKYMAYKKIFKKMSMYFKGKGIKSNKPFDKHNNIVELGTIDKIHYGCGSNLLRGWINADIDLPLDNRFDYIMTDLTKKHPFINDSFCYAFSEDFIEHLTQEEQLIFLYEVYRTLRKNGVVRFSFPGLEGVLNLHYFNSDYSTTVLARKEAFNKWQHKHFFSFDELKLVCEHIGFSKIEKVEFGKSDHDPLNNLEQRIDQISTNMYVEITK